MHFRQLSLVTPASAAIPNATIDSLTNDAVLDALVPAVRTADGTVGTVVSAVNVSGMTGPGALTLNRANFAQLTSHFATLFDQLRQLPATRDRCRRAAAVRQSAGAASRASRSACGRSKRLPACRQR